MNVMAVVAGALYAMAGVFWMWVATTWDDKPSRGMLFTAGLLWPFVFLVLVVTTLTEMVLEIREYWRSR